MDALRGIDAVRNLSASSETLGPDSRLAPVSCQPESPASSWSRKAVRSDGRQLVVGEVVVGEEGGQHEHDLT